MSTPIEDETLAPQATPSSEPAKEPQPLRVTGDGSDTNFLEKMEEIKKRRDEKAVPQAEAPPAESAASATPAQAVTPSESSTSTPGWWTEGMSSTHGFLNGKNQTEVENVVRSLEETLRKRAKQRQGLEEKLTSAEARIERLLIGSEPVPQRQAPQAQQSAPAEPARDELEELDDLYFTNRPEYHRRNEERMANMVRSIMAERDAGATHLARLEKIDQASRVAIDRVMEEYGLDREATHRAMTSVALYFERLAKEAMASGNVSVLDAWMAPEPFIETMLHYNPTLKKPTPVVAAVPVDMNPPAPRARVTPAPQAKQERQLPQLPSNISRLAETLAEASGRSTEDITKRFAAGESRRRTANG